MSESRVVRCVLYPDGRGSANLVAENLGELPDGFVRCRTIYSLISPGTEKTQVSKALGRSSESIVKDGNKLGYCATAKVVESKVDGLECDDIVACYGSPYVCHGSMLDVPRVLAVKTSGHFASRHGAFGGLGAIALHGFRLARVGLGDRVLVIGAGIIGNFCAQLARLAGCRVTVTDPVEERLDILLPLMKPRSRHRLVRYGDKTHPELYDAVCVTAANLEEKSWRFILGLVRRGGRVVMLGDGPMTLPRDLMFETEAEVIVSRAGGPGRYDSDYEAGGHVYPPQFVRWPEGENLREFVSLLEENLIDAAPLLDAIVPIREYKKAYEELNTMKARPATLLDWTNFIDGDFKL